MSPDAVTGIVERQIAPAGPFLLGGADSTWLVESGAADVFLVRVQQGAAVGARTAIGRVEEGAVLVGLPSASHAFLAHPTPGSRVRPIGSLTVGRKEIDDWVLLLASAMEARPPGSFLPLNDQSSLGVGAGNAFYPPSGVVWIRCEAGSCWWLGNAAADPVACGVEFPVTASAWLTAMDDVIVRPAEPSLAGLMEFGVRARTVLVQRMEEEDQRARQRIRDRIEADQARARGAQRILSGVLDGHTADEENPAGVSPLLAAVRMAAAELGLTVKAPASGDRPGRDPVEAIARASSFRVRRIALRDGWWREDSGPIVCRRADDNHPMALIPRGAGGYDLLDPATRSRRGVTRGVAAELAPFGYTIYRPFPSQALNAFTLITFGLRGLKREAAVIGIAGALAGALATAVPLANQALFDTIIPSASRQQLWQMFAILLAAGLSGWLLGIVRSLALLRLETKMDFALQAALWDRLISLPATFYREYTAGDLAVRSLGISAIRQTLTGSALSAVLTSIFSVFSFILMVRLSPAMAAAATVLVALAFVITFAVASFQIRLQRQIAERSGRLSGFLPQLLGGISKIRVSGIEHRVFARWATRFVEQKRLTGRARALSTLTNVVLTLFQAASTMSIFFLLPKLTGGPGSAGITTGAFLAFQAAFAQVLGGASSLSSTVISVLSVVPTYERSLPILKALPEVNESKSDPGALTGDIEFAHVSFRYQPDQPPILRDVSLHIRPGQFVALVGGSGSGKSTLCRLLLGFETPETGSIFYDGKDLAGLDIQAVRRQTGVVLQHGVLMGGDLYSSIAGASQITIDDAWEAARMAGLDEDIRNMPMGMHTVIPDGGLGLSGGQRQRLHIARAVALRPRVVVFDEATSALDNQTQAVVMESLNGLKATRIVIAHRLSTIRGADRIFVLNKGVIEEEGTFDELMARGGFFAALASRQIA